MLEMDKYCELLYVAELVNFGKRGPQMSKDVWLQLLKDEQLLIEGDVQHSILPRSKKGRWTSTN
jgi:hypothetical protein